ncbi:protein RECOGNITION OF PERONOSPORA PARASITICA 7-like [Ziziphus jujuba]|uniref:Protein RECOGNITION OF PERONOSPORA PARASITICA 7-like n=1 Tax=Ziziphus jujuba TaxID=326968 RepID=A0A6P3ZEI4_ZIZJJ|nr:protein RECOGNITION OF PERONOSPORA PARASITICA 7-like [Ziziphus jujuba]XP_048326904.2 protein RECOGNITION OF PERONOSPORA PARASITICA 7-like [Ziziphus jujuba]XP_048326906.2 protein RECOGNITION OF PERONOSPORA PARASITICA 7-like [Ziziphus jujuba]XP_048326907.2 protein RECOGNITION OF PERONOSPORA PARASITICA 7-like [Ziziphus jujuba]
MAEFVLSRLTESVVSLAVRRLSELLIHEAPSLTSVEGDVARLNDELRWIIGFLKDVDRKQERNECFRELVIQVRDVAYDIKDVIDIFIIKISSCYFKTFQLHRIHSQINSIQTRLDGIFRSMQIFGLKFVGEESVSMAELRQNFRRSYPDEDDDVINLEVGMMDLKAQLMKQEDRLCIVSIAGMGGLGKTTLAKKVYNLVDVKRHFDSCAWVFISQTFVPRDVLIEILMQVDSQYCRKIDLNRNKYVREISKKRKDAIENLRTLNVHDLICLLKDELKEKRYLVVLDDIWRIKAWDYIKHAFPKGKKGSKVLFTTRNKEVALLADPSSTPIEPPFLTHEESWELLQRKAFVRDGCPPEFEQLGREMVKKCGGLPLGIVLLGGFLRTKASLGEWKAVQSHMNSYLNKLHTQQQYEGVNEILALSYYDLPYELKPCFLYLGNFPEDWEIPKKKLIRKWIAEGFVQTPTNGEAAETVEDVAELYLRELIDRCMVQVCQRDHTGIGVKTCRLHDLMRDFCMLKAREDNFSEIIQNHESRTASASFQNLASYSRRLSIHHPNATDWVKLVHPHLRSLLLFETIYKLPLRNKSFILLRVLELEFPRLSISNHYGSESSRKVKVPREIGNLIHLRYLGLKNADVYKLPNSIGNLRNLLTFDLRQTWVGNLPRSISRLVRLRHLLLPRLWMLNRVIIPYRTGDFHFDKFSNIETLKNIPSGTLIRYGALHKLTNLRNLVILLESDIHLVVVLKSPIFASGQLRSLNMLTPHRFLSWEPISSCNVLSKLHLDGNIAEGIHSNCHHFLQHFPASLTKLLLSNSNMKQDPMVVLEKLPSLRFLSLSYFSYSGSRMVCSAHGFPMLETLKLKGLDELEEWRVEEGALANLRELDIRLVHKLKMLPEGLKFLPKLQKLSTHFMMLSFLDRLEIKDGIEGEDYYKVSHVPSVFIGHGWSSAEKASEHLHAEAVLRNFMN